MRSFIQYSIKPDKQNQNLRYLATYFQPNQSFNLLNTRTLLLSSFTTHRVLSCKVIIIAHSLRSTPPAQICCLYRTKSTEPLCILPVFSPFPICHLGSLIVVVHRRRVVPPIWTSTSFGAALQIYSATDWTVIPVQDVFSSGSLILEDSVHRSGGVCLQCVPLSRPFYLIFGNQYKIFLSPCCYHVRQKGA